MHQQYFKLATITALMLSSASALAIPFNSFDPRSMAMGGTGVAVGDPSTAPFFNPALLSATDDAKKYSIELPIIGIRAYDPNNLQKSLNDFQNGDYVGKFNNASANYNATQTTANLQAVSTSMSTLSNQVTTLSNKAIAVDAGAAFVLGVPGKGLGWAFYTDATATVGGVLNYTDNALIQSWNTAVTGPTGIVASCFDTAGNVTPTTASSAPCTNATNATNPNTGLKYFTVNTVNGTVTQNFDPNKDLTSNIHVQGVVIGEAGLSLSHSFGTGDGTWSLGVTPKAMQLQLYDAVLNINSGKTSGATGSDYQAKYSSFNFDLGAAKSYNNGWRTGFVVKNVIPQSYDFKSTNTPGTPQVVTGTLNLKPQARVGVSHENSWSTVALDVDLTQNDPAGFENKTQYAALGGEVSAWGWAAFRAGYRADLVNNARSVASLGLGLSPRIPYFKIHADLAVAGNANEAGASLKLGFNF